jgi:hypothetical protein
MTTSRRSGVCLMLRAPGAPATARSRRRTALNSIAHRGQVANKAARRLIPWLMIQMMPASTTSPLGPRPEISHQRARKSLLPAADWSGYGCKPAARRTRSASLLMTQSRPSPPCSRIDKPQSGVHIFKRVDTTRCLRPPGYGECITSLSGFLCRANESVTQASDLSRSPMQRSV